MSRTKKTSRPGVGIDFGTTNSLVAIYRTASSEATVYFDKGSGLPHPSVVWYRLDEAPRVGREAKQHISGYAEVAGNAFIHSVKRNLGKPETYDVFGKKKTPCEVAEDIFYHLWREARDYSDADFKAISEAVVTVPIQFDGRARRELRKAADAAGIFIKTFVHEPFAALVGYVCGKDRPDGLTSMEGQNVLVFDWGGGTLDITVGRSEHGRISELATAGLTDKAGDHFDTLLGRIAVRKFQERHGISSDELQIAPSTKDRYAVECEGTKIALSMEHVRSVELPDFCRLRGTTLDIGEKVTREEFEAEIEPVVDQALSKVSAALSDARLTPRQIDLGLLIGGSSLIPLVQHEMRKLFGHTVVNIPNANSIIAEGAAIVDALDLCPSFAASVAIELSDGTPYEVFKSGDLAIPAVCNKSINLFCTDNRDGQGRLIVGLADPKSGSFQRKRILTIPVSSELPRPYVHERITAEFSVDQDLVLHIDAKAATQPTGAHEEIVDLKFALAVAGAGE